MDKTIVPPPLSETIKDLLAWKKLKSDWLAWFVVFALVLNSILFLVGSPTVVGFTVAGSAMLVIVTVKHRAEKEIKETMKKYEKKP
jgi:intracellular septation protein A